MMMNVQGRAAGLAVSQKSNLVGAVAPLRTRAAFTSSRVSVKVAASAEPSEVPAPKERAPAPRNSGPRVQRPAPTVDLATVKPGQEFEGTVAQVAVFGAFVNFGASKDGLVHISQFPTFVKNIADLVKIGDKIKIKVLNLDAESGKIALTMKGVEQEAGSALALATAAQAERAPPAERKANNYAERKAKKESDAENDSYNFGTGDATADAAARERAMALSKETAVPEPLEGEVGVADGAQRGCPTGGVRRTCSICPSIMGGGVEWGRRGVDRRVEGPRAAPGHRPARKGAWAQQCCGGWGTPPVGAGAEGRASAVTVSHRTLRGGDNPEVGQVLASVHVIEMDPVPGAFPLQELDQALRKSGEGTRLLGREVSKKPRPNHPGVGGRVFQRLRWWIWGQGCASVGQAGKATGTQHPAGAAARSFHLEPTGERDALEFEWASTRRVPISSALFGTRLGDGRVVVFSDVPGYEEIAFIMEEEDGDLNDDTLAELEAMDDVEVVFETDMPPYLTRVEARVTRIEEYGIFCEFEYEGESLSALMSKEEMKVPFVKLTEAEQGDAVAYVASAAAPQSSAAVDRHQAAPELPPRSTEPLPRKAWPPCVSPRFALCQEEGVGGEAPGVLTHSERQDSVHPHCGKTPPMCATVEMPPERMTGIGATFSSPVEWPSRWFHCGREWRPV
ncbi:MAG: hypothetical protein WDW38_004321 [Sanguina aurantia]